MSSRSQLLTSVCLSVCLYPADSSFTSRLIAKCKWLVEQPPGAKQPAQSRGYLPFLSFPFLFSFPFLSFTFFSFPLLSSPPISTRKGSYRSLCACVLFGRLLQTSFSVITPACPRPPLTSVSPLQLTVIVTCRPRPSRRNTRWERSSETATSPWSKSAWRGG